MAPKAMVVCDLVARRGRLSSPGLRFLGVELRIVRFRVRAVNSSTAWNKSLRVGLIQLAEHISHMNAKGGIFIDPSSGGTAKRRSRDVRIWKPLHPQGLPKCGAV
jgi:hypothetical protein